MLIVEFEPLAPAPVVDISLNNSIVARTSVSVAFSASSAGTIYCSATRSSTTTLNSVLLDGSKVILSASSNLSTSILINNLVPGTAYYVFCASVSRDGIKSTIGDVLTGGINTTTLCCKTITATLLSKTMMVSTKQSNVLKLMFDGAPSKESIVGFTIHDISTNIKTQQPASFYPNEFTIMPHIDLTQAVYISWTGDGDSLALKDYSLLVSVAYPSVRGSNERSLEYSIDFPQDRSFNIIDNSTEPPAPVLQTAVFSSDGTNVELTFDSLTNRNGSIAANQFVCSQLLEFVNSSIAICSWLDSSHISIYPGPDSQLTVASSIGLKGATLKSFCTTSAFSCGSWTFAAPSTVAIQTPTSPLVPTVTLSTPTLIGSCADLTIDLSNSIGSGGRSWKSLLFKVSGSDPNASAIESFLNEAYSISPPTPVPSELLTVGFTYYISAQLCNFIDGCGTSAEFAVTVVSFSAPTTSIKGTGTRTIIRKSSLLLNSDAYIIDCGGSGRVKSFANLVYQWSVSVDGVQQFGMTSNSQDITKFGLSKYTLATGVLYTIQLSVYSTVSQKATVAAVGVFVEPGTIQAVIAGGSIQSAQRGGSSLSLDASASFDEDEDPAGALSTSLSYVWTCAQSAPVFSDTCGVLFVEGATSSVLIVQAEDVGESSLSTVVVTVSDVLTARFAQATVVVETIDADQPVVSITSSRTGVAKLNVNSLLSFSGTIAAGQSGVAQWTVSDSAISLSSVALTPVFSTYTKPNSSSIDITSTTFLALPRNVLPTRATLVFTLTAVLVSGVSSSSSLTVVTNGAPIPGQLTAVPPTGYSMNSSFMLTASSWTDEDAPITYEFSYVDGGSGTRMTIQSKSETSFGSSTLPAGLSSNAHLVQCVVIVYDSLDASARASRNVEVNELVLSTSDLSALIAQQLSSGSGNADVTKQVISTGTSVLNMVNCSLAPSCSALYRSECGQTAHTCGSCVGGYVGDDGDANSKCVVSSVTTGTFRRRLVTACVDSTDCDIWSHCNMSMSSCVRSTKACPGFDCSGHGVCSFEDVITGETLSACNQGDLDCIAVCSCHDNYALSDCSLTAAELLDKQNMRAELLKQLSGLVGAENPEAVNIESWSNSLSSITQPVGEITSDSGVTIASLAATIVENAPDAETAASVLVAVNTLAGLSSVAVNSTNDTHSGSSSRRRLATSDADSVATLVSLLDSYTKLVSADMVPGQSPIETIKSYFRVSSSVLNADASSDGVSSNVLSTPQSFAEIADSAESTSVDIPSDGSGMFVNMIVLDALLYSQNNDTFNSNPLLLNVNQLPCTSSGPSSVVCSIIVKLKNNRPTTVDTSILPPTEEFKEICTDATFNTTASNTSFSGNYTCQGGHVIVGFCNERNFGKNFTHYCPTEQVVSLCNSIGGDGAAIENDCFVVNFTDSYTTCSCPLVSFASVLNSSSVSTTSDDEISVNYVAMLKTVSNEFGDTFTSIHELTGRTILSSVKVLVTVGTLAILVIIALVAAAKEDRKVEQMEEKLDKSRQKIMKVAGTTGMATRDRRGKTKVMANSVLHHRISEALAKRDEPQLTPEEQLLQGSLPAALKAEPFEKKFLGQVKTYHKWVGIIFHYSPHFSRSTRVLLLTTNLFTMLFLQAVLYPIATPDDGSCDGLQDYKSCTADPSPFDSTVSKCRWIDVVDNDPYNLPGECIFAEPGDSFSVIIFMAVVSIIFGSPLIIFGNWLIMKVISAPSPVSNAVGVAPTAVSGESQPSRKSVDGSVAALSEDRRGRYGSIKHGALLRGSGSSRPASSRALSDAYRFIDDGSDVLDSTLNADVSRFMNKIIHHRTAGGMDASELKQFDAMWGINSATGHFHSDTDEKTLFERLRGKKLDVHTLIVGDMKKVRVAVTKEIEYLSLPNITDQQRGSRLLRLFQQDLMPGLTADIVNKVGEHDSNNAPVPRPMWVKATALLLLFCINGGMLFYVFLFAISQDSIQQDAWLKSFLLQVLMDCTVRVQGLGRIGPC